jgi:hypothetical protein
VGWMFFIYPPFAHQIFPILAVASSIGELPLQFWLIIKGVNILAWKKQVLDSTGRIS